MPEPICLRPKMGLIPEVSAQNYETLAKAIREYVSNAVDAQASNVWITMSRTGDRSTLDIRDDGTGMTLEQLKDDFLAVGGSRKWADAATIGRIGIGFLAVVPLCEEIRIYTKAAESESVVAATIDTSKMLPEGVRYDEIATTPVGEAEVLPKSTSLAYVEQYGNTFTLFSLGNLRGDVTDTFSDHAAFEEFKQELRSILPLPFPANAPLKQIVSKPLWLAMTAIAKHNSVRVFLNDPKTPLSRRLYGDNEARETFLYHEEFIDHVILAPNADIEQPEPVRITGFLVCDEPSVGRPAGSKMTGVTTRVLNVAVDEDTFFGLEGREERKKRVAGELFIFGFDNNKAIQINRNAFTETHAPVKLFRVEMQAQLLAFFSGINRVWRAKSSINRAVKKARSIVDGIRGALQTINERSNGLEALSGRSRDAIALMKHPRRRMLRVFAEEIDAAFEVVTDDEIKPDEKQPYRIELAASPRDQIDGVLRISTALVRPRQLDLEIAGELFELRVVSGTAREPPCAIDVRNRAIVVNENHPVMLMGDAAIIRTVVFLRYAREVAATTGDMERLVIDLLCETPDR